MKTTIKSSMQTYAKTFSTEEKLGVNDLLREVVMASALDAQAEEGVVCIWEDGKLVDILLVQETEYDGGYIYRHFRMGVDTLILGEEDFNILCFCTGTYCENTYRNNGVIKSRETGEDVGSFMRMTDDPQAPDMWVISL